ncbi:MAG: TetR/AcrR family transcriptional regulator [Pseudomonadota bacterium]
MKSAENTRKTPTQPRSRATLDVILEAAAQLLESVGEPGFNTNALAERAGVSIGTLYRYFPDKRSIINALALQEKAAFEARVVAILAGETQGLARDRAIIRAFLHAFSDRTEARRLAVTALYATHDPRELMAGFEPVQSAFLDAEGRPLSRVTAFVLSRAVQGAMRAAVLEGADFLLSQEFEDELVHLGRAYLGHPTRPRGGRA